MFGLSTFAQAPYASLGGTKYDVAVDESITFSDAYTKYAAFAGTVSDSITLNDESPTNFNFFFGFGCQ